jgi:hypothetical protein
VFVCAFVCVANFPAPFEIAVVLASRTAGDHSTMRLPSLQQKARVHLKREPTVHATQVCYDFG